ncbi:MAG: hypothetical protein JW889_14440 [Verrucomicrobia bacterium]|nr:hypothetical protein [Verrucomicrobiota bacterium]
MNHTIVVDGREGDIEIRAMNEGLIACRKMHASLLRPSGRGAYCLTTVQRWEAPGRTNSDSSAAWPVLLPGA